MDKVCFCSRGERTHMIKKQLSGTFHVLSINEHMVLRDSGTIEKSGLSLVPRACVDFHFTEDCDPDADEKKRAQREMLLFYTGCLTVSNC